MSKHLPRAAFEGETAPASVVPAPPARPNRVDRVFDLHPALHIATFGAFALYLAVMWAAFGEKDLLISFGIFAVFIAGFFFVPAAWTRIDVREGPLASWGDFMREGFDCLTGHLTAKETIAQVMIMPAMLLFWGVCVAAIKAFV
jgi:hypothetical protein